MNSPQNSTRIPENPSVTGSLIQNNTDSIANNTRARVETGQNVTGNPTTQPNNTTFEANITAIKPGNSKTRSATPQSIKDQILAVVSEADIISHYVPDFKGIAGTFFNPLTPNEENKSLSIYQHKSGKGLFLHSKNTEHDAGDIFQLVADLKGLNSKTNFPDVCQAIVADMNLNLSGSGINSGKNVAVTSVSKEKVLLPAGKGILDIQTSPEYSKSFLEYWMQWKVTEEVLRTLGIQQVLSNKDRSGKTFGYDGKNAALFTVDDWEKIIVPALGESKKRVLQNAGNETYLFGLEQARKSASSALVLCEGEKDLLVLAANGFAAITLSGATARLKPKDVELIKEATGERPVFIVYDNDDAGKTGATRNAALSGFKAVSLPDTYNDIADYFAGGHSAKEFSALLVPDTVMAGEKKNGEAEEEPGKKKKATVFHVAEWYLAKNHAIRYNSVSRELEIATDGFKPMKQGKIWQPLNENELYVEINKAKIDLSFNKLVAILKSSSIKSYNPITQYFSQLPVWDGVDHIAKLVSYFSCTNPEHFLRDFKKWLIRVVRGIFEPNNYNKQAFILVHSKQNSGKTEFCRWLTPPALANYRSENFTADKDGKIALTENLFVMIDELASLSRTDENALKSLFSLTKIKERLPYEKRAVNISRIASILGSTNDTTFLKDPTGSVRFLCIEIQDINWNYRKEIYINALWSQVYALYKSKTPADMTQEEIAQNELRNAPLQNQSMETEKLYCHFEPSEKGKSGAEFLTATAVIEWISAKSPLKFSAVMMGRALKAAAFERVKDGKVYGYWMRKIA